MSNLATNFPIPNANPPVFLLGGIGSLVYAPGRAASPRGGVMRPRPEERAEDLDDAALVERFQKGDEAAGALEVLFGRYAAMTYAFFARGVGQRRIAEELNQELYLQVIEALPRFRQDSQFKTWLFRLAYHHLSNLRRRWRTHLDEVPAVPATELWEQLVPDDGCGSPEREADDGERRERLQDCLARLPEVERAVVFGHYYHELTLEVLTGELGLTNRSGARATLIAAQRRLRRCMEHAEQPRHGRRPGRST